MAESSMFYTSNRLVFGESRRNVGTGKSAKWLFIFLGITTFITGKVVTTDVENGADNDMTAEGEAQAIPNGGEDEVQQPPVVYSGSLPLKLGGPMYTPKCLLSLVKSSADHVDMPLLEKRLTQIFQCITDYNPNGEDLKPLKEVVQQHINQTANGIPVDLAVDLCQMKPGTLSSLQLYRLALYISRTIALDAFGPANSISTAFAIGNHRQHIDKLIKNAIATLIIN